MKLINGIQFFERVEQLRIDGFCRYSDIYVSEKGVVIYNKANSIDVGFPCLVEVKIINGIQSVLVCTFLLLLNIHYVSAKFFFHLSYFTFPSIFSKLVYIPILMIIRNKLFLDIL